MPLRRAFALLLVLASCGSPARPPASPSTVTEIAWHPLDASVFERARRENRMILVDVGIEGCTACRWMYEDTYRHAAVIERVDQHFVAVAVDANLQPDLGERWERWGWPATIVLTPDGEQVLALRGNRRPPNFLPILDELIERHAAGTLSDLETETVQRAGDPSDELGMVCGAAAQRLATLATERGGYGEGMRHALGDPVRWELARGADRGDEARTQHALRTLAGYALMIDPEWGGVFVAAGPDFEGVIPEKRTVHQAPILAAFAEAHLRTGDARWLEAASQIDSYLRDWMRAEDGTFFATQEDVAPSLPASMNARAYYQLPDAERRRYGIPPIDHAVYTDLNGRVIEAYVRLHQASGDSAHLQLAVDAAEQLVRTRQRPEGWMAQTAEADPVVGDDRMRAFIADERAFLLPQGPFGLALLALHSATGEARWLEAATRIGAGLARLEDPEAGGFFASEASPTDELLGRRKPVEENLVAARFLTRLGWATHDQALRDRARRTVRAILPGVRVDRLNSRAGLLAHVLEELLHGPVELTVLGDAADPGARTLFDAAHRAGAPRGIVHYEAAGVRYPDQSRPALFVCTDLACSSPVFEADAVAAVAARMSHVDDPTPCAATAERAGSAR